MSRHVAQAASANRTWWTRLLKFLDARIERQKDAWGASLLVKRRMTSPYDSKMQRKHTD
jgi:hypothetical protein